jgi:peptidoglycan/xylan/chitin deacetylase (PgdA/CDA1 family)
MEMHPGLVKEMVNHGHEIANHTYNHPHLTSFSDDYRHELLPGITREFLHTQLFKTDSIYHEITSQHLKPFWRAPFGEYNQKILTWAAEIGYLHIRWTGAFDTNDWVTDQESDLYMTPDEIFTRIMQAEEKRPFGLNGVIVLMHLGSQRDGDHIFEVLPKLIQTIRDKGYILGCVSDLLVQ